jgi:hypothetical protein
MYRNPLDASPYEVTVSMNELDLGTSEFGRKAGYYQKLFREPHAASCIRKITRS